LRFLKRNMLNNYLHKWFPRGSFGHNIITLVSGTGLAQAIGIVATPILTRLFTPVEFGIVSIYVSIVAILTMIICGRYEIAIVLPDKEEDAQNLVGLSLLITLISTLIALPVVFFAGNKIVTFLNISEISPYLWYIPLSVVTVGSYQTLNYWSTRKKNFGHIAAALVSQSVLTQATQIGAGIIISGSPAGLIWGRVAGQFAATFVILKQFIRDDFRTFIRNVKFANIRRLARTYSRFPKFLMLSHSMNAIAPQLPVFFIAGSSTVLLGLFGLANRLMAMPLLLISSSFSQVFYSEAARELNQNGACPVIYRKTLKRLTLLSLAIFIPLFLLNDNIYVLLLGKEWIGFASIIRALIPLFMIRFVVNPLSAVFMVTRRTDLDLYFQIIFITLSITSLWFGGQIGGGIYYVYCYSGGMSLGYLLNLAITHKLAKTGYTKNEGNFEGMVQSPALSGQIQKSA